jgi:hypothetical protein
MFASRERLVRFALCVSLVALAPVASLAGEGALPVTQDLALDVSETGELAGVRMDNPLNEDNWQGRGEWKARMTGNLDWYVGVSDVAYFSFKGDMSWDEAAGDRWSEEESLRGSPVFRPKEALVSVNATSLGASVMAGRTSRRYGSAVMMSVVDFLSMDTMENDAANHGKCMAGLSFFRNPVSLELWYSPIAKWVPDEFRYKSASDGVDSMVLASASALVGVHRFGAVYYHNGASSCGAYYSGQVGDSLIPYAEFAVSDHPLLAPFVPDSAFSRSDGASLDALVGCSVSPRVGNVTAYLEYRYRSSGFTPADWDSLESALDSCPEAMGQAARLRGSVASRLPYFYTATHTAGIRIQNASAIADCIDYNLNAFYLAPDGLYLKAESTLSLFDRMKLLGVAEAMVALGDESEIGWWNETWRLTLAARWTVTTSE